MSDLKILRHLLGSKHRIARALRFYHKHLSPKARKKKKHKRKIAKRARVQNRKK